MMTILKHTNRRNVTLSLLAISLLATACAIGPRRWASSNVGATQQQFVQDRYACYQETRAPVGTAYSHAYGSGAGSVVKPSCSAFISCLAARGYTEQKEGNLVGEPRVDCY